MYFVQLTLTEGILAPTLIGAGIAFVLGAIILIVFKVFAVPVDERAANLAELLPGGNCGGCGFASCMAYAESLVEGEVTETNRCTAGGEETVAAIANFLGVEPGIFVPQVAHVYCQGSDKYTKTRFEYSGSTNCAAAAGLFSGPNSCTYGCLGMGDCMLVCDFNAIYIEEGVARINHENCVACGKCVDACPKHLIHLIPKHESATIVTCSNHWPAARIRKDCSIACISCGLCLKACPVNAITMEDNLAVIDQRLCIHCDECLAVCPTTAIRRGLLGAKGSHQDNPKSKTMVKKEAPPTIAG
ncbi:MAG: RnfABCDGE type electron transport complex subunit B [Clostridiales bacterium]|nr:RnfABCDGE type electron transport complex subunit B [Clostridiales bacterium]